jgi:hypothetical protein
VINKSVRMVNQGRGAPINVRILLSQKRYKGQLNYYFLGTDCEEIEGDPATVLVLILLSVHTILSSPRLSVLVYKLSTDGESRGIGNNGTNTEIGTSVYISCTLCFIDLGKLNLLIISHPWYKSVKQTLCLKFEMKIKYLYRNRRL